MTNFEWLKKEITVDNLVDVWVNEKAPWCDVCNYDHDCVKCLKDWCVKEHKEPMPNLEVGMMVHVKYSNGEVAGLGIVRTWNGNLIVTYEDGGFDLVDDEDVIIDAIYKAPSFKYIDSTNLAIWSRN